MSMQYFNLLKVVSPCLKMDRMSVKPVTFRLVRYSTTRAAVPHSDTVIRPEIRFSSLFLFNTMQTVGAEYDPSPLIFCQLNALLLSLSPVYFVMLSVHLFPSTKQLVSNPPITCGSRLLCLVTLRSLRDFSCGLYLRFCSLFLFQSYAHLWSFAARCKACAPDHPEHLWVLRGHKHELSGFMF